MDKLRAYQLLGVDEHAEWKEIKRAYARKLKEVHPEDDPEGFIQVQQAYEYLKQPTPMGKTYPINDDVSKIQPLTFEETVEKNEFDLLLEQENERKEQYQKAITELQNKLLNPDTTIEEYQEFYQRYANQEFLFEDECIGCLVDWIKTSPMNEKTVKFFYSTYHLRRADNKRKKELKRALLKKIPFRFMTPLFVLYSVWILWSQVRFLDLKNDGLVILTFVFQICILTFVYQRLKNKRSRQASVLLFIMVGFITYGFLGTALTSVSERLMNRYVDCSVPLLIFWFFVLIGLCMYSCITSIRNRRK